MSQIRDQAARALNAIWYGNSWLRWILWPVSLVYRALIALRRLAFRLRLLKSTDVGVPVIVVGNLTVGGTGKTPLVIWLARKLSDRGFRVGIVCRGYGGDSETWPRIVTADADAATIGDEAKLLARRSGCAVAAGPDRSAAALLLLDQAPLDVILSDDGLQHYALKRAFEIAVFDGTRGTGNGLCLPAGPLREPRSRLREVDAVVVNDGSFGNADAIHFSMKLGAAREIATGREVPLAEFTGRPVHAVAAIGNPGRFFDSLANEGLEVDPHPLADHAPITANDVSFADALPVLVTEKDAVKCEHLQADNLWSVTAEPEFAPGHGERFERRIMRALDRQPENQ
jgi:tetraacyldisaccharide 4'-kinase